jgi:NADH-quinone oxidoreductase subunit E
VSVEEAPADKAGRPEKPGVATGGTATAEPGAQTSDPQKPEG